MAWLDRRGREPDGDIDIEKRGSATGALNTQEYAVDLERNELKFRSRDRDGEERVGLT